jgi:CDP-6-deoxy-D-xylo-4-hexulose-3-dehydrase
MIKLMKSTFHEEVKTKAALLEYLAKSEVLSMGAETRKFEEAFAKKQGRKYAIAVNSGSSANLLLIQALLNLGMLKKGDRIGFSALTWSTNVMPLIQLGLTPVPIDCELETLNVSSKTLSTHLDSLQALFLTNVLGFAGDIGAIRAACAERGVVFLEDNCESLGSIVGGTLLGNFGLASTFSFFVGHHLSTIEGGMITTDNEELADMLLIARSHGWGRHLSKEKEAALRAKYGIDEFYSRYTFYDLGYNVRPMDLQGFIGTLQLQYWDLIVAKRQENFRTFQAATEGNPNLMPFSLSHMETVSNFAMPLIFKDKARCDAAKEVFTKAEVEIRPVIAGDMTAQPFYKRYVPESAPCEHARSVHDRGFYFGNNQELTSEEVETLVRLVKEA